MPRRKWWKLQWYSDDDTEDERRLIIKIDMLVVPYAVLAYWVKYIDQSNLSEFQIPATCLITCTERHTSLTACLL